MIFKDLDINLITKLLSQQLEQVTCLECCKLYSAPVTAKCGHTLCHGCWCGRRYCPVCAQAAERKILKLNLPLQNLTDHVQLLIQCFERLFNIKFAELEFETTNKEQTDTNKNVTDWLSNSQNQFSVPICNVSTPSLNPHVEYSTSEVQIHTSTVKASHQAKVGPVPLPQDDWDNIEALEDADDGVKKQKNVTELKDIEVMDTRENDCTTENPRRSNRNKDIHINKEQPDEVQNEKADSIKSTTLKQSFKIKETWNHAKRMRQEFSRQNKENRNKLNVSIETVKKSHKSNTELPEQQKPPTDAISHITSYELSGDKETQKENNVDTQSIVYSDPVISSDINSDKNIAKKNDCHSTNNTPLNIQNENGISIDSKNMYKKGRENELSKVKFFKKSALHVKQKEMLHTIKEDKNKEKGTDDIEITIRVGKIVTNVCIKQKDNKPELKIHTDREIQTSLIPDDFSINISAADRNKHVEITDSAPTKSTNISTRPKTGLSFTSVSQNPKEIITKSDSTKKNTASADTRIAHFGITTSSEKELPDIMESDENNKKTQSKKGDKSVQVSSQNENIPDDINNLFDCEFSKSPSVQMLKASTNVPSYVLVPTQNKNKKCTQIDKRPSLDYEQVNKKQKLNTDNVTSKIVNDSEYSNYDVVMKKVFANIDSDIGVIQKDNIPLSKASENNKKTQIANLQSQKYKKKLCDDNKHSENLFSNNDNDVITQTNKVNSQVKPTNESLTSNICREFILDDDGGEMNMVELGTPCDDGSDVSVVEETPQKNVSNLKAKQKSVMSNIENDISDRSGYKNQNGNTKDKTVINLTNSVNESLKKNKGNTLFDIKNVDKTIVTPLTINKFVEQIHHKSTPVARKSLNFNTNTKEDPERTYKSSFAIETTQEKEFMNEVFKDVNISPEVKTRELHQKTRKMEFCIAGSCLMPQQVGKLKRLCKDKGWRFVDEYTNDVTHLVIDVDEENKSKRSIKYMRALAAGKWIIGYAWVEKCIQSGTIVPEEPFECLDSTGEPGPRRSRRALRKLFADMAFYCLPPFAMLEDHVLKEIIENAGGTVAGEAREVRADDTRPAFVLAETDNTQDPKYTYLAMDLGIVPLHWEWILNCLGCYALLPIQEVLLCPASVLPDAVSKWPQILTQIN